MDFITQLSVTNAKHDAIVVFVDRFHKMARFAATTTTITAEETAQLFFDNVYCSHGLPEEIVSDRDLRFTSAFAVELYKLMGTKQAMSTAYHPQTDGQTERMSRILEDYLRHFVAPNKAEWDRCLFHAEFAVNNVVQDSTGYSPFYLRNHNVASCVDSRYIDESTQDATLPSWLGLMFDSLGRLSLCV
eukprot:jgi/Astpho2/2130/Aster-x0095